MVVVKRSAVLILTSAIGMAVSVPASAEVVRTVDGGQITWEDDFLRAGGAEFIDAQRHYEYCLYGTAPRPDYTAQDPILAGGYLSTSITIGNGIMGINHDEYVTAFGPAQFAFAGLGWQNQTANCIGGSLVNENDAPFDDDDICVYGGIKYNPWHLNFSPIDYGPWGPDARPGYAGMDDDGDGTTDWGNEYTPVGGNNQEVGGQGDYHRDNTPDQMDVLGTYDGTTGCANRFPSVEEYRIEVTVAGPYPNNGIDDDSDGTVDNEVPWEARAFRICTGVEVIASRTFESGEVVALDRGLSIQFTELPFEGTQMVTGNDGRWDIEIWPAQSANALANADAAPWVEELYGRNQKFHKDDDQNGTIDPEFIDPHGLDGKAGIAGVDDDGNGVTDEFPTEGRPGTDDDFDNVTDEFDEVVLDELGERNAGDDADDTGGRGAQIFPMRGDIGSGSAILLNIDPGSGGSNLFSIREFVIFQEDEVADSDELGSGFYLPGVEYSFIWCSSTTCYGAQLWIGNDGGNPVETVGPVINENHTGVELAIGAEQFGSGVVALMERWPLVTNAQYDDKFWAIEGTTSLPKITVQQDRDRDGDVDGVDFSVFASCFNKAGNPPRTLGCSVDDADAFDTDNDGDVDGVDFAVFASCFNKAGNRPRGPGCYTEPSSLTACVP